MSAHTHGPWAIDWNITRLDIHSDGENVATMHRPTKDGKPTDRDVEIKANARLIAAAPDLLKVLQELEESSAYWSEYDVPIGIVERIQKAIAKATKP